MRRSAYSITIALACILSSPVMAQGRSGGMGGGFGGGMGGMGLGHGMNGGQNQGMYGGSGGVGHQAITRHSSIRALDNPRLGSSLESALSHSGITVPSGGLKTACTGFGNLGQCVSALHVAKNLNLDGGFDSLKALTTGNRRISLGAAIGQLKPAADARAEEQKARMQAHADLREVEE